MTQDALDLELLSLLQDVSEEELAQIVQDLPDEMVPTLLSLIQQNTPAEELPGSPAELAAHLVDGFRGRPHIDLISEELRQAVEDVEAGKNRRIALSMPPRSAKTTTVSQVFPAWALSRNPSWKVALTSYDGALATSWARQIRRWIDNGSLPNLTLRKDSRAAGSWETVEGGGVVSRSIRQPFTGRGANVLIIDDPHKDFVDAHSGKMREQIWNWWLRVAQLRLEPPWMVIVVQTRWHEDDLIGRLLSPETEGDPEDWQFIKIPAIANHDEDNGERDPLGRKPGEPVLSPLIDESVTEAVERWDKVKTDVGSYVFESMYQQEPSAPTGSIFHMSWWRYWTTDPDLVPDPIEGEEPRVVLVHPEKDLALGDWLDSWDMTFKGGEGSDFVVGQRWAKHGERRFLIAQKRGRWSFTETIQQMNEWRGPHATPETSPYMGLVNRTLIESAANGEAIMDTLKDSVSNIKPIIASVSKEARARSVSPDVEAGKVYLPHPSEPGNEWVQDFLNELRQFPTGTNDDQVDSFSQALREFRSIGPGVISNPAGTRRPPVARTPMRSYGKTSRQIPKRGLR